MKPLNKHDLDIVFREIDEDLTDLVALGENLSLDIDKKYFEGFRRGLQTYYEKLARMTEVNYEAS